MKKENLKQSAELQAKANWPSFFIIDPKNWPDLPPPEIPMEKYWKPKIKGGRTGHKPLGFINFNDPVYNFWFRENIINPNYSSILQKKSHLQAKSHIQIKSYVQNQDEQKQQEELARRVLNLRATYYIIKAVIGSDKKYIDNLEKARQFFKENPDLNRNFTNEFFHFRGRSKISLNQSLKSIKKILKNAKMDEV